MTLLGSGVVTETVGEALLEWGGPPIHLPWRKRDPERRWPSQTQTQKTQRVRAWAEATATVRKPSDAESRGPRPPEAGAGPLQSPRRSHPAGRQLQTPGPQDWEGANSCRPHRGPVALSCASGPELARPAPAIRARLRRWREGTGPWPSERAARGHAQRLGSCPSGRKAVTWPRLAARAPGDRSI